MGLRGAGLQARLEAKLETMPNGCIEYMGSRQPSGHGSIGRGRRGTGNVRTHRVVWELANGPIPPGMNVCHKCDNPPCCNIEHLFLGTQQDNMRDMKEKGRGRGPGYRGEQAGAAKLTESQVLEIHAAYAAERLAGRRIYGLCKQLAERYGVSVAAVSAAAVGRTWAHLHPEQTRRRNSGEIEWD